MYAASGGWPSPSIPSHTFPRTEKSVTVPTQQILYLGLIIDSVTMTVSLPEDKFRRLHDLVREAISVCSLGKRVTIRALAKVTGFLISCLQAVPYGMCHYRSLEYARDAFLCQLHDFDSKVSWPLDCLSHLYWWASLTHPVFQTFDSPLFTHLWPLMLP